MAQIIAHRGLYKDNSNSGILDALSKGYGAEFDIRDGHSEVYVEHDPMLRYSTTPLHYLLTNIASAGMTGQGPLAIDVKATGLGEHLRWYFDAFPWLWDNGTFFFDLAGPDHVEYLNRGLPVYGRISDIEAPFFDERAAGLVWDHFGINDWMYENNAEVVASMKREGKKIVQIGHDLWNRDWKPSPLADYVITSRFE